MKRIFKNARIVLTDRIMDGSVLVRGNVIAGVSSREIQENADEVIDCKGLYLSPGFVDIHVHGGGGADFMDGEDAAVEKVLNTHAKYGTTSMLPTTLSSSPEKVIKALQTIEGVQNRWREGPRILGTHLEGNFFSLEHKGAQDPEFIFPPTPENYMPIVSCVSNIKRISCSPEIENALNFAEEMYKRGIRMSVAHSNANYEQFLAGVNHGFSHVTHIYNGCSFVHDPNYYCSGGVVESALLFDEVCVEAIADGRHVAKELLKLLYKVKGPDKMHLCTDAMSAAAMPADRTYKLGNLDVVIHDSVAVLKSEPTFAGSVCTTNRLVRTMYHMVGVPLYDAVRMMSATPAKQIGEYYRLGSIRVGKLADINLFDEDIQIKYTMIDGKEYQNYL